MLREDIPNILSLSLSFFSDRQKRTTESEFFKDVDAFLERFSKLTGEERKSDEEVLLKIVLPSLEESTKTDYDAIESYETLCKLSCCRKSPTLTNQAQHQLLYLICKASTTSCNARIKNVEKILRGPLIKTDSVFHDDGPEQKGLRLVVYSRVVALMVAYLARGHLPLSNISEDDIKELRMVVDKLNRLAREVTWKKKDRIRYSVEFIQEGIGRILSGKKCTESKLTAYLEECERAVNTNDSRETKFLYRIRQGKMHWFDMHVVLYYLHSQVRTWLIVDWVGGWVGRRFRELVAWLVSQWAGRSVGGLVGSWTHGLGRSKNVYSELAIDYMHVSLQMVCSPF